MTFFEQLMASFPDDLQPPEALVRYFRWVQDQGCTHVGGKYVYANIDPSQTQSSVVLEPVDPEHARYWLGIEDPAINQRLAPFCRTGGDGSYAALWRDDAGTVHIVHLGSGSGSTKVGLFGQTPVDFLRLLALGYEELCWREPLGLTPEQAFEQAGEDWGEDDALNADEEDDVSDEEDDDEEHFVPPLALRAWLKAEFGVEVPATAADIVGHLPDMAKEADSTDPFYQWLNKLQGWEESDEGDDDDEGKA